MVDAVTTQVLFESASEYVVAFTNISDGTGESDVNKVDVSALTPGCSKVIVDEILYATDGMAVRMEWDATTDVPFFLVPQNQSGRMNLRNIGTPSGLTNNAGTGNTGDVFFTTIGHTAGDTYWIALVCRKVP